MDSSKDSLTSARTQRYEDRNMNKDRLDSNAFNFRQLPLNVHFHVYLLRHFRVELKSDH